MSRNTQKLSSVGTSHAQQLAKEANRNGYVSTELSDAELAQLLLLKEKQKRARKAARHAAVMEQMPVTRFLTKATPVSCQIAGMPLLATVRSPKEGKSIGWYAGEQVVIEVDGVQLECTIGLNITVNGSKPVA